MSAPFSFLVDSEGSLICNGALAVKASGRLPKEAIAQLYHRNRTHAPIKAELESQTCHAERSAATLKQLADLAKNPATARTLRDIADRLNDQSKRARAALRS